MLRKQGILPKINLGSARFQQDTKWCNQCQQYLSFDKFGTDRRNLYELSTYCRSCRSRINNQTKRPYKQQPKTPEFLQLFIKQGGVCAICKKQAEGKRGDRNLHVDHCHKTGKTRGLLCGCCNRGLGLFKDSPELLKVAMLYL